MVAKRIFEPNKVVYNISPNESNGTLQFSLSETSELDFELEKSLNEVGLSSFEEPHDVDDGLKKVSKQIKASGGRIIGKWVITDREILISEAILDIKFPVERGFNRPGNSTVKKIPLTPELLAKYEKPLEKI